MAGRLAHSRHRKQSIATTTYLICNPKMQTTRPLLWPVPVGSNTLIFDPQALMRSRKNDTVVNWPTLSYVDSA